MIGGREKSERGVGEQTTTLLALLLVCGVLLAVFGGLRLSRAREAAADAQRDLVRCRAELADLEKWRAGRTTGAPLTGKDPELNGRLSAAAVAAGISGELASIEPGTPGRVRDADYTETKVFVRFGGLTLAELSTFLRELSAADSAVRTTSIELSTPEVTGAAAKRAGEMWTCDLTLAYLTFAPRGREVR